MDHSTIGTTARLAERLALAAGCSVNEARLVALKTVAQTYHLSPMEAADAILLADPEPTTTPTND